MINTLTRTVLAAVGLAAIGACQDTAVPNFRSPQINPETPSGIQYLVTGIAANSRADIGQDILTLSGFSREVGVFTTTDSRFITEWMGDGNIIPSGDFYGGGGWAVEFQNAKDADAVIAYLPKVAPAYTTGQIALITGVMKTFEAYNMMLVAETRDTNGVPIYGWATPAATPAPILCIKDVWKGISAMLDSGEAFLDAGASATMPINLPPGYGAVSAAGPSGTSGTFAGFNRALAAYAKLQYAYGVTRSPGGSPADSAHSGTPLASALIAADSAVRASNLYQPGALAPATAGDFTDPTAVYHNFSSTLGDLDNPVTFAVGQTTTVFVLDTVAGEIEAGGDLRAVKLIRNTSARTRKPASRQRRCGGQHYRWVLSVGQQPDPDHPQRRAGAHRGGGATGRGESGRRGDVNQRDPPASWWRRAVRRCHDLRRGWNQLLHEMRASNIGEPGEERIMAVRNYGLQKQQTTTWGATDTHATLLPIPIGESGPRNGNIATTCP